MGPDRLGSAEALRRRAHSRRAEIREALGRSRHAVRLRSGRDPGRCEPAPKDGAARAEAAAMPMRFCQLDK